MAGSGDISAFDLPHAHKEWPIVRGKLSSLADKTVTGSLEMMGQVVMVSPYWRLDKPPLLNTLNKALGEGDHFTKDGFCNEILPYIAGRALEVETLFPDKIIQLLPSGPSRGLTLTRRQVSCLLALACFCLLDKPKFHGARFQRLSLIEVFEYGFFKSQTSKCLCILGYFDRLRKEELEGNTDFFQRCVTIERKALDAHMTNEGFWRSSFRPLTAFNIHHDRFIESFDGCMQIDFANEYIGGGVLQQGNVQEEIRFMINPECLVSILFCETMNEHESILITGAEAFSSYRGYGGSFTYTGPYTDPNPVDARNRCSVDIVAIDAIPAAWLPGGAVFQFKQKSILRELYKAYCGFSFQTCADGVEQDGSYVPVATGNWGCGAFGGNKELKVLVQWLAASMAGRDVHYCTFRDASFGERLEEFVKFVASKDGINVGKLVEVLLDPMYSAEVMDTGSFQYVMKYFN